MTWGSPEELERRRRIRLALWAYAYEYENTSLVSDAVFDAESALVDVTMSTGNPKLDKFFAKHFEACTGMWVHKHPEMHKVQALYRRLKSAA